MFTLLNEFYVIIGVHFKAEEGFLKPTNILISDAFRRLMIHEKFEKVVVGEKLTSIVLHEFVKDLLVKILYQLTPS